MAWQTLDQQYDQKNDKNERSNYLKDILLGLQIANNNDPWTLAGFGIGKFLSNYLSRGEQRRREEKRNKAWEEQNGGTQGKTGNGESTISPGTAADVGLIARGLLGNANLGAGNIVPETEAQAIGQAFQQQNPWAKYISLGLR